MNSNEFCDIMEQDVSGDWVGDNALKGLLIINKYLSLEENILIERADYDIIHSVDAEKLIKAGITKEDTTELRKLNWMVSDDNNLVCYV